MDDKEFIEQIKEWAWKRVQELAKKDLKNDYIAYWDLKDAIDATQDFLVHVCGAKASEIFMPDDVYQRLVALDEEREIEERQDD